MTRGSGLAPRRSGWPRRRLARAAPLSSARSALQHVCSASSVTHPKIRRTSPSPGSGCSGRSGSSPRDRLRASGPWRAGQSWSPPPGGVHPTPWRPGGWALGTQAADSAGASGRGEAAHAAWTCRNADKPAVPRQTRLRVSTLPKGTQRKKSWGQRPAPGSSSSSAGTVPPSATQAFSRSSGTGACRRRGSPVMGWGKVRKWACRACRGIAALSRP